MLSHKNRGEKDKTIRNANLDAYKNVGNKKQFKQIFVYNLVLFSTLNFVQTYKKIYDAF